MHETEAECNRAQFRQFRDWHGALKARLPAGMRIDMVALLGRFLVYVGHRDHFVADMLRDPQVVKPQERRAA
jgi:hypothetical protein